MTIEQNLERIATALETIAAGLSAATPSLNAVVGARAEKPVSASPTESFFDTSGNVSAAPVAETPKKGRPRKTETTASAPTPTPAPAVVSAPEPVASKTTEAELREHIRTFVQRNNTQAALDLIGKYGAKKIKDIQTSDYDAIAAACEADRKKHEAAKATK